VPERRGRAADGLPADAVPQTDRPRTRQGVGVHPKNRQTGGRVRGPPLGADQFDRISNETVIWSPQRKQGMSLACAAGSRRFPMTVHSLMHVRTSRDGVVDRRTFFRTVAAGAAAAGVLGWKDAVTLHA